MIGVDLWCKQPEETYNDYDVSWEEIYKEVSDKGDKYKQRLILLRMDSLRACELIEDMSLDFVFIDANHKYECVKGDILCWRNKIRQAGYIMGHDYGWKGVLKALGELDGLSNITQSGEIWYVKNNIPTTSCDSWL